MRHAKSQVPCPMPDDDGVIRVRPKLPSGEPVPEVITRELTQYEVIQAGSRWHVYAVRGEVRTIIAWRSTWALANAMKLDLEERTQALYQPMRDLVG